MMKKKARFVAIIKEGFRNFDLKNLDLEFQIKKNRKIRESKDIRREIERSNKDG